MVNGCLHPHSVGHPDAQGTAVVHEGGGGECRHYPDVVCASVCREVQKDGIHVIMMS